MCRTWSSAALAWWPVGIQVDRTSTPWARTASTHGVIPSTGHRESFSPAMIKTGAVTRSA